jgi:hypothetical protein
LADANGRSRLAEKRLDGWILRRQPSRWRIRIDTNEDAVWDEMLADGAKQGAGLLVFAGAGDDELQACSAL